MIDALIHSCERVREGGGSLGKYCGTLTSAQPCQMTIQTNANRLDEEEVREDWRLFDQTMLLPNKRGEEESVV